MDNIQEQRETLESLCQHINDSELWRSTEHESYEQARLVIDCPANGAAESSFRLLVKRYNNIGNHALKVNLWEQNQNSYLGAVGYHHESSLPYCKQVRRDFNESDMYDVLMRAIEANET